MAEHYKSLTDIIKTLDEMIAECHGADYNGLFKARNAIAALPDADVKPVVRGEWIGYPECLKYTNAYSDDHIVCSACEECFSILDNDCVRFNFCPNCGADMRGEQDE